MHFSVALLSFIVRMGIYLSVALALVIILSALRLIPQNYGWLLKSCFALGLATVLAFATAYSMALRHFGGVGITPSGLAPISIVLAETGILGLLVFWMTRH